MLICPERCATKHGRFHHGPYSLYTDSRTGDVVSVEQMTAVKEDALWLLRSSYCGFPALKRGSQLPFHAAFNPKVSRFSDFNTREL